MLLAPPPPTSGPGRPRFIVTLSATDKVIEASSVKDEEVRLIMREYGLAFSRHSMAWQRELDNCSGPAADRLAELATALLSKQFHVELPEEAVKKIVDRSWEVEHKRWVNVSVDGKSFMFRWEDGGSIYYKIKALPGAKYGNRRISVPLEMYEYVEDFAEQNDFRFTNPAKAKLEELKSSLPIVLSISAELLAPKPPVPVVVEVPTVEEVYSEFAD